MIAQRLVRRLASALMGMERQWRYKHEWAEPLNERFRANGGPGKSEFNEFGVWA
jgi:hypothetical protein